MSNQPWMQLWVADFIGDTLHLSDAEVGQYMLLLMAMWRNGGTLPDEPKKLARIARNEVSTAVMAFFERDGSSICQKRLLEELTKAKAKSAVRSKVGKAGARAKALKYLKTKAAIAKANASSPVAIAIAKVKHSSESEVSTNVDTPLSILKTVLNDEQARALLDHRRKKRSPLTLRTAKLLAGKFGKCSDPNAAADTMMVRGWQGFEPEWLDDYSRATGLHGWRQNGKAFYVKPGSEPFEAHKKRAVLDNDPKQWEFAAAEKSGIEVEVLTLWPKRG